MPNNPVKIEKKSPSHPPVVVILGHVDHGKTSILDYIRQSKVAQNEAGGITQHIGAYQVEHQGKTITFIDTPGHEAFSAMRSRGAKVADVAVLVVAADEGVKPQTKEAIGYILHLNLPFLVSLNKMDKPTALPDKAKKELADNGVLVESLGGKVPAVFVSAKTGLGINDLLEMILLLAEMGQSPDSDKSKVASDNLKVSSDKSKVTSDNLGFISDNLKVTSDKLSEMTSDNFTSDSERQNPSGIIIESKMDAQRGPMATLLVREGVLRTKDAVAAESASGQIKSMENFLGQKIASAGPSTPALVFGFDQVPPVGEEWQVMPSLSAAKERAKIKSEQEKRKREAAEIFEIKPEQKVFNLILKADVSGSLEALREALKTIPQEEVIIRLIKAEVGNINENDLKLADSAKAKIYGFRVRKGANLEGLTERLKIKVATFEIIYELAQSVRQDAGRMLKPEINQKTTGQIKILAVFKTEGKRQIIGGKVISGKAERGVQANVSRDGRNLGEGKIIQLQQNKKDTDEATKDKECGLLFESAIPIEKGDILELYREERKKREL